MPVERICSQYDGSGLLEERIHGDTTGNLREARETVVCDEFHYSAQGVRGVQACRVEQGRIAKGDRSDVHFCDAHKDEEEKVCGLR